MDNRIVNQEVSYLRNKISDFPITNGDGKFNNDGEPLKWPGCSIILPISKNSLLSNTLVDIQKRFKEIAPHKKYTYLPQSSFHMTLFDCCNVSTINTSTWPKDISFSDNYLETARILSNRIKKFKYPNLLRLKLNKFFGGFSTLLMPATTEDNEILRNCRDDLSNLLKIRHENHYRYTFHITLSYLLKPLTNIEIEILKDLEIKIQKDFKKVIPMIELSNPKLCTFNNMYEFNEI